MHIGLKSGAAGAMVERLHKILHAAGFGVDPEERDQASFGASTLAALKALQAQRGLPDKGEVDEDTLKVLLELEEKITIDIHEDEPEPQPKPRPPDEHRGEVHGRLVDEDGAPLPGVHLELYAQRIRGHTRLDDGDERTDEHGKYSMHYHRPRPLNLQVMAYGADEKPIAQSAVAFAAPATVEIDLTTAPDGIVRQPSAYTLLLAAVDAQLHDTPLQDLKENKDTHELRFLASASGQTFADVARLYIARRIALQNALNEATPFGLFSEQLPASLTAALGNLPDAGIDDTFIAQVLAGVLAQSRATLAKALGVALAGNVLPASYAPQQDAQLTLLDALRVQSVGTTPYIRGKTPLSDLLAAGNLGDTVSSAFTQAYAAASGRLGPTWKTLRADKTLTKEQLAALNTTLSAGELLSGNLPLVKDTLQRLAQGTLPRIQNLALLDQSDWEARIREVDPQGTSVPPVLPGETADQRIARFAKALAQRFASRYPSTAFAGGLIKAQNSSFTTKDELVSTLLANPSLSLARTNVDQYVLKNKLSVSNAALTELKTAQRLYRLSPHYASIEALNGAGYTSAQSVYFKGQTPFVAQATQLLGSASLANAAWVRAQAGYATVLSAYGRYNLALNGVSFGVMTSAVPPADAVANLPSLQSLFGSLDYCECSDCRSVYSPGAYLVDLLQFLKQRAASGGFANARDVLLARRPDLQYIALGCDNTDITLPYIDLVNELLEAAIAPPATPVTLIDTTGTSDERRALPQQVSQAAYDATAGVVFPLILPFDLGFAQTEAFLTALGTSLTQCMSLCGTGTAATRASAQLGLNPAMQAVINGNDPHQPWERWGFTSANPTNVIDPKTRQPFTPSDWIAALSNVPVLLSRTSLTLDQLYQLLEVLWVTAGAVTLNPGFKGEGDAQVVSCDTEAMTFTGLDAAVLDRANRFLRLLTATQLQMWELDWALSQSAGGLMDDGFLVFLAGALALRSQTGLPLQEILSFWGPLQTRDVVSHLGDPDAIVPSTYSSVFRSPTLLASWGTVFVDAASLSGTPIVVPSDPPPTPLQLANLNAIKAALGLSADDIAAILAATGAANALTLDTLNTLLRHQRLAASQSLSVPDLLLWITLTGGQPFGGAPADTAEFLRRLALLQATGMALYDLDNLLRNGSAAQSAHAFTLAQATSVLQTIRDALAKLTPAAQADGPTVQAIFVNALATATSVTANVVTPVLANTGVLPLPAATIAQLLAQTSGVDPSLFPQLVAAFNRVAKAAALSNALLPTDAEFAFLVQNAAAFNWIDPSNLPLTTPATSPYVPFERLVRALLLDRRQSARTPKLFDVLGSWLTALPADLASAITGNGGALAQALNASTDDVLRLASSLGATTPTLGAGTLSTALSDMGMLAAFASVLDTLSHYHIGATAFVQLASSPPTPDSATAAMGVFQAQYSQSAWFGAVQPVEDNLRQMRRDALVAYLIGQGSKVPISQPLLSSDDIFDYFLIDPEMCPCGLSTRLLEASLAVQQFVQQCFLNLVPQVTVDASADSGWNEWSWMQQFRLWQANRQVFLYPENYVLPELRTDKSPMFSDLENDLKQSNCDSDAATSAFENYLRKLVEISNLVIAAHYQEQKPDGSRVLHVFARTRATPPSWYYRTRSEGSFGSGIWNAWQPLNLDIHSDHLLPVIWDQRLHLIWPTFKSISEKSSDQGNPTSGGTASTSQTFWSVEFAMSELSAGQWQAKQTIAEKMYFNFGYDSPLSYTFRAFQDPSFNLQFQTYIHGIPEFGYPALLATGMMPMPDAPLSVTEDKYVFPNSSLQQIDTSQEPSYLLVNTADFFSPLQGLAMPTHFGFSAQDLVYANYLASNPGSVSLYVLCQMTSKAPPSNVELLGSITNPHIVIPQQEPVFDSADPFFVTEPARSYFVQPHYYTVSSSPQELDNLAYIPQWSTRYAFSVFYHPFARTFLRELEIGGTDQLMQRNLQINPQQVRGQGTYNFANLYQPQPPVATPYPDEDVDFEVDGAYALYNWELFYHAPMFVASQLMVNQQYQTAMQWLEYIFDPTDPSPSPVPGHYWRMAKFYEMNANDWLAQQIQTILTTLAADAQQGISDPATAAAIQDWLANPFDPHRVAKLRIGAYGKATVMKFLDNLIAWGDSLYAQYTMENVAQAEQLYVFADLILGPLPDQVRLPTADQPSNPDTTTYADIESKLDEFSNALVDIENVIAAPSTSLTITNAVAKAPTLPRIVTGSGETLFFCIPPNDQLLAYWSTVADRLYKIRHCLNLQGVAQPLPLYAPPINPLQLIEQAAGGATSFGAPTFVPVYRFTTYIERAIELANDVRAYGALVLSALEKKDAETLAALRANQELDIQTRMLDLKTKAVTEAQDQITVLQNQRAVVQIRHDFYANIAFMNDWEIAAIALQAAALIANGIAVVLDMTSGVANVLPSFMFGAAGFGGSPMVTTTYGGQQVGSAASSWASVSRGLAGILGELGGMAATMGGYQRRQDEWTLQANLATAELVQIDSQITAANDRLAIANNEVDLQNRQITNAQAVSDFLTNKYTNAQLYDWMLTQLTTVHTQAFQLTFSLGLEAQATYQYELGNQDSFIQFGYWNSQYKGLTAGESLLFDLRRMQAQYLLENTRELELVKHVSLALTQPMALVQLLQTGTCSIALDEALFDRDHPGHYFRRLRSAALTIPCVTGPYSGVNATLVLDSAIVRIKAPIAPYTPALANSPPGGPDFITSTSSTSMTIATSHGQNDPGLFDLNMRDERWLPFEGQGAISTWTLVLDPRDNNFDFSTVTDVILHLRYTARSAGGDPEAVRTALKPQGARQIMLSVRNSFSNAYYAFFNPSDTNATEQDLILPITSSVIPFSNLGTPSVTDISLYMVLAQAPKTGTVIAASFGPTGGAANAISLAQVPGNTNAGTPIAALGADGGLAGPVAPGSFSLAVPEASVPAGLGVSVSGHMRLDASKFEDIVIVINYKVA
jgi:hypothetical protein